MQKNVWLALCLGGAPATTSCPATEGEGEEGEGEEGEGEEGEGEGAVVDNPFGFAIRAPRARDVPCNDALDCPTGSRSVNDADFVCSLTTDGHDAVVYLRATPTAIAGAFPLPVYDEVTAFIAEDGAVSVIDDAGYDFGGNHHNDSFFVVVAGVRYTFNHSSFGFGFRACQPPDCLQREAGANFTDGCNPDRTLPEACIAVSDPLAPLVDNFATCAGDPG
jgi:hypothetical protein